MEELTTSHTAEHAAPLGGDAGRHPRRADTSSLLPASPDSQHWPDVNDFSASLASSFIAADAGSDRRLSPRFLTNDRASGASVLAELRHELRDCTSFDFSVAFVTEGGLQVLVELLLDLERRGIPGRILTSTYQNFNAPHALRKLLSFRNLQVRVFQGPLHAKGYYFDRDGLSTFIIGSSNLTQTALTCNREWNILFRSFAAGELCLEARREFDLVWDDLATVPLSQPWIDEYERYRAASGDARPRASAASFVRQPLPILAHDVEYDPWRADAPPSADEPDSGDVGAALPGATRDENGNMPAHDTDVSGHSAQTGRSGGSAVGGQDSLRASMQTDAAPGPDMSDGTRIVPNAMQRRALEALDVLHRRNERRALLVSATGTGKTYLAAFDVLATRPARILFVAHRKRILQASMASFERVLGERYPCELYQTDTHPRARCVFAMVESLRLHLDEFAPDEFDYVVIDEAHRTGAAGYQRILAHFHPRFCLGMTATPARTDGYDVYALFNHVIAYRITLADALEMEMLAPFHYFGIADLMVDDEAVDDVRLFARLTSDERVRHITERIEQYSVRREGRRGLVFCNRNDEAAALSARFNELGYRTRAISGATSDSERNRAIEDLEAGRLEYLFSVDILNEGVDIPSVNQIIMLRRTESAIVFVQQLGRGLRKEPTKEYTLVLDFIGNYRQNYLVPIALADDHSYNKDTLRRVVKGAGPGLPGCSTISFDRVAEARILRSLEQGRFGEARLIRSEYEQLRAQLGRIPMLCEFDEHEAIDPLIIFRKYGSYAAFLERYERACPHQFGQEKLDVLRFVSQRLATGKRRADLAVLRELVARMETPDGVGTPSDVAGAPTAAERHGGGPHRAHALAAETMGTAAGKTLVLPLTPDLPNAGISIGGARLASALDGTPCEAVLRVLSGAFAKEGIALVREEAGRLVLDPAFAAQLRDDAFRRQVLEALDFGLARNARRYAATYKDTDFVLYAKYTREEVCRLLRWEREPNMQNIGGYFHDKVTNTFPVFINYEKDPQISLTTQYEDRFVSDRDLVAISKSKRTLASPEIRKLAALARARGMAAQGGADGRLASERMRCFLFVRKNTYDKDDGTEFYFLGEIYPTGEFLQIMMPGTSASAVEIGYTLDVPVRRDLYEYLLSDVGVEQA